MTLLGTLLCFPSFGRISRVTDRGYGFIRFGERELWVHLRDHDGRDLVTMDGLVGCTVLFVQGGHASRYAQKKGDWRNTVVWWRMLDDIAPHLNEDSLQEERQKALAALDQEGFLALLAAEWYTSFWESEAGLVPLNGLVPDSSLDRLVQDRLSAVDHLEELVSLLASVFSSPWYGATHDDRDNARALFFKPSRWAPAAFVPRRLPLKSCPGYEALRNTCGVGLSKFVRRSSNIAIDLESDGEKVFQFGWNHAGGSGLRADKNGLKGNLLREAANTCFGVVAAPCIIGHNLLAWDYPILKVNGFSFPEGATYWDTLVTSFILAPWRDSHALVVPEGAHQADADAAACFSVFELQVKSLESHLGEFEYDTATLIDQLIDNPKLLLGLGELRYPKSIKGAHKSTAVYPSRRRQELRWQRGCSLKLLSGERMFADPELLPTRCLMVAKQQGTLLSKVVSVIVTDALENTVQVHLSDLPPWLVSDELSVALKKAHEGLEGGSGVVVGRTFYLAEDLFELGDSVIESLQKGRALLNPYPWGVIEAWQASQRQELTESQVRDEFPRVTEGRTGRALLGVVDKGGAPRWLLHDPSDFKSNKSAWCLLPALPGWLKPGLKTGKKRQVLPAAIPRWREGDDEQLDVTRLFVSPDTHNRQLYLRDVLHCILNLVRARRDNEVVVVGMRWRGEAEDLQQNLVQLGYSSMHPGTPLRRLEHVIARGLGVVVCESDEIPKFTSASERLGASLCIVLDEVPAHDWHAALNPPDPSKGSGQNGDPLDSPSGAGTRHGMGSGSDDTPAQIAPVKSHEIQIAAGVFLAEWIEGVLGTSESAPNLLILDSRLAHVGTANVLKLKRVDVGFFKLEELLDEETLQVFNDICYPRRATPEIPNTYEAYRAFLEENWGYKDFRPGPQQEAIEHIIKSDQDLLLRLPTGGGKSLVFHLPALFRSNYSGRLTVVVTPLRALMRDQVEGLWEKGFRSVVDYISGGRDAWVNQEAYQGVLDGRIQLIFVAPERFRVPHFVEALERRRRADAGLEFVVFDEAHCVSEWGFEFRPDYLYAAQYIAEWFKEKDLPGNPHRLLLTSATVTQRNRLDLEKELGLGRDAPYDALPVGMPHPIQAYITLESFDVRGDQEDPSDEKFEKLIEVLKGLDLSVSAALVFVRRRKDCHRVSEALNMYAQESESGLVGLNALPFHAGLPEAMKTEACDLLRGRTANVLVCTKAFGMGMDIPHIHACIHHRAPNYIEEYLQEVGRVGRDKKEREGAGHERVKATLLYNQEDIDQNLAMVHQGAVSPPDLQDFLDFCHRKKTRLVGHERDLCVVPPKITLSEGREFDKGQVTSCLFWLERMGGLRVEGRLAPLLNLVLDLPALRRCVKGKGAVKLPARIAESLLGFVAGSSPSSKPGGSSPGGGSGSSESMFGRVVKGILRGVFAILSRERPEDGALHEPEGNEVLAITPEDPRVNIGVSLPELISNCGCDMDELFTGLHELSQVEAVWIRKSFSVEKRVVPTSHEFWWLLDRALECLLKPTGRAPKYLRRKDFESQLMLEYQSHLEKGAADNLKGSSDRRKSSVLRARVHREVFRAISTTLKILRDAKVGLRETYTEDGKAQYIWQIPARMRPRIISSTNRRIQDLKRLLDCVDVGSNQAQGETFDMLLTDLMDALGAQVRVSQIREIIKLAELAGFYEFNGSDDEWATLISLDRNERLELPSSGSEGISRVHDVCSELIEKNELQVLRSQAMVLLSIMPPEARRSYIDGYFQCVTLGELKSHIENTVGDVDEAALAGSPLLQGLLSQVQQDRFTEEIEKLSPSQLGICAAAFDKNLLVNAGPGSGKTHVLMMRCAHLIHVQGISPSEILVLAFNRAVVYEIRDRIRTLFRALGYGTYVNSLDVATFHGFALRHQDPSDTFDEDAIRDSVHLFAQRMARDQEFSRSVAGRYKAVLVDEFQDMNEDFYTVVRVLLDQCQGGGMVIGDDDQDILAWDRRRWSHTYNQPCPLDAAHYFADFQESFGPEAHELTLNYRSVPEIVARSNKMISTVAERIGFRRMKVGGTLTSARTDRGFVELPFDPSDCMELAGAMLDRGENVAILCRSNMQCRQVYEMALGSGHIASELVNLLGKKDFRLHKLRDSGALLDIIEDRPENDFVDPDLWAELLSEYKEKGLADQNQGIGFLEDLYLLVKNEMGRPRIRDVRGFLLEMDTSDINRLREKTTTDGSIARLTIATVHKVKGLEFYAVFLWPSSESFPFPPSHRPQPADAAEEARLYYVAMTRASDQLYVGWGNREKAWLNCKSHGGASDPDRVWLKGSPKEVYVSWGGSRQRVGAGVQEYIANKVCLGDNLTAERGDLLHDGRAIGRLSKNMQERLGSAGAGGKLRVANVIRYPCGDSYRENNLVWYRKLHESVKQQAWFYLVLVEHSGV